MQWDAFRTVGLLVDGGVNGPAAAGRLEEIQSLEDDVAFPHGPALFLLNADKMLHSSHAGTVRGCATAPDPNKSLMPV